MRMDKLQARMVMEILGRPPENIIQALNMLLDRLAKEKGVKIVDKKVHDAVEAPGQKDLFTSFAEVEVELDSIANYLGIVFAYMPSHVELIYPENINLRNSELNELANSLTNRLHNYDAIAKRLMFERDYLMAKLDEITKKIKEKESSKTTSFVQDIKVKKLGENKKNEEISKVKKKGKKAKN